MSSKSTLCQLTSLHPYTFYLFHTTIISLHAMRSTNHLDIIFRYHGLVASVDFDWWVTFLIGMSKAIEVVKCFEFHSYLILFSDSCHNFNVFSVSLLITFSI